MLTPQFVLPITDEMVIDLFAGGGGASTGIEQAIGRHVDVAINHDPEAVALHQANHPQTLHFVSDVFEVDPQAVTKGRRVGLLWASPDCKHFSKAKGGKPVSKKIRSLAWVVVKWAKAVRPRIICLENVEEFQTWGPLGSDGMPCPNRKGQTFRRWVSALRGLGYQVEWRELRACDYGAPTIRKRLFLIARCDGQPIVWPVPTHGAPGTLPVKEKRLKPWRTAAECIDWSIPAPSIFERKKPLADATCRRIAKGIVRYVIEAAEPFIVNTANSKTTGRGPNAWPVEEPLRTITSAPGFAIAVPTLVQTGYGEREGQSPRVPGLDKPLGTVVAGGQKHALVAAFLAKHYGGVVGHGMRQAIGTVTSVDHHSLVTAHMVTIDNQTSQSGQSAITEPIRTTVTENRHALVASHLVKLRNNQFGQGVDEPIPTLTAGGGHVGEVLAFLVAYYGSDEEGQGVRDPLRTVPTRDRFGLVMVKGEPYAIVDIGLRMLAPRELYRAQGFPDSYIIDHGADGRPLTKTAQVRMCGNSVCPPLAAALVRANYRDAAIREAA